MRRHASLQPFSREHHRALLCWRALDQSLGKSDVADCKTAAASLRTYWNDRFLNHMADEEALLLNLLNNELGSQLLSDHDALRSLFISVNSAIESDSAVELDTLANLAAMLRSHIRWEEREVFPYLQSQLPERALQALSEMTHRHKPSDGASCNAVSESNIANHKGHR